MKRMKISTSKTWFISDTHFLHSRILEKMNVRSLNFSDINDMTDKMIINWNINVPVDGVVMFLGDFGFFKKKSEFVDIFNKLNGIKHLVVGNHDNSTIRNYEGWESVTYYNELSFGNDQEDFIVVSHYPMLEWNGNHEGSIHLYGHLHGRPIENNKYRCMDVGVDSHNFSPISFNDMYKCVIQKEILDHHGVVRMKASKHHFMKFVHDMKNVNAIDMKLYQYYKMCATLKYVESGGTVHLVNKEGRIIELLTQEMLDNI